MCTADRLIKVDQSGLLASNSLVGDLQSPPSGWFEAVVQAAIYVTALESADEELAFQQLAVSHAAHDSPTWTFHGIRNLGNIFRSMQNITARIGINEIDNDYWRAIYIGRNASVRVMSARQNDCLNKFVNYFYGPRTPRSVPTDSRPEFIAPVTPQARN